MKELNLKIKGTKKINPTIEVDGKIVKLKKNSFGNYEGKVQVQNDQVNIKVYRYLELNSKFWFLKSLLYFIVSIFGIFDSIKEKKCIVIDFCAKLNMQNIDNATLELNANNLTTQGQAFKIISNCELEEISNGYYVDTKANKRRKFLNVVKFVVFVGTVIGLVFLFKNLLGF